jgi:hypothetical protein
MRLLSLLFIIFLINQGCKTTPHQKYVTSCDSLYFLNKGQIHFLESFPGDTLKALKREIRKDFDSLQTFSTGPNSPIIQGKFDSYFKVSDQIESLLTAHQQLVLQLAADQNRLVALKNMLREQNSKDADGNEVTDQYLRDILLHESQHLDSVQITTRTQHEQAILVMQQVRWLQPLVQKSIEEIQINTPF